MGHQMGHQIVFENAPRGAQHFNIRCEEQKGEFWSSEGGSTSDTLSHQKNGNYQFHVLIWVLTQK